MNASCVPASILKMSPWRAPRRPCWPIWNRPWEISPSNSSRSLASRIWSNAMFRFPIVTAPALEVEADDNLRINAPLLEEWLIAFLRDEIVRRRGFDKAVVAISGGVDSSLVAFLLARALEPKNVLGIRMPYKTSS